jgi:hypothetical protein
VTTDARPLGNPAGEDLAAQIIQNGWPAEVVGQPGEEPPVDGGVVRPDAVASAPAVRQPALDASFLEGLDVTLDGSAADPEPLGEGGVADPGFVPPGLDDGVPAFGRTGRTTGSGQGGPASR